MNTTATPAPTPISGRLPEGLPAVCRPAETRPRGATYPHSQGHPTAKRGVGLGKCLAFSQPNNTRAAPEFAQELQDFGRIYMCRFMPVTMRPAIDHYPARTPQAAAIVLMIQDNLDPAIAQHPEELAYGRNAPLPELGTVPPRDALLER